MTRPSRAGWCLVALIAAILAAAWLAPWHSNFTVDDRSYLEMVQAISARGLPYQDHVHADRSVERRARWNIEREGKLWSTYPPLFPYVAAPIYHLGGVRGVIRFNIALLALLAIGVSGVARRLGAAPAVGVAAAAAAVLCTPVWTLSFVVSSFTLAIVLAVWSVRSALEAMSSGSRRAAALAGLLAGAATAAHLLAFPMLLGLGAAILALRRGDRRLGAFFWAGTLPALALMSGLNRVRFGSFNPITYGPCPWRSCAETGILDQSVTLQLRFVAPCVLWLAISAAAAWLVRRSRRRLVATLIAAGLALVAVSAIRAPALKVVLLCVGFLVDVGRANLGPDFARSPDGLGNFLGPWVIKSLLQSTPFLAVAAIGLHRGTPEERRRVALVLAPCAALLATLVLRANMPLAYALGYPFLHMRYLMFAAPLVIAVAITVLGRLRWERGPVLAAALLALALALWLGTRVGDADAARRVLLLRGSLLLCVATLIAVARGGRAASWLAAAAVGYALAVNLAVDLPALARTRNDNDAAMELLARHTPSSFALVGWPREIDPVLALSATRDIEYADLYEASDWSGFRRLIDHWSREGRPIFAVFSAPTPSPWPDVRFEPLDPGHRLVRVSLTAPP